MKSSKRTTTAVFAMVCAMTLSLTGMAQAAAVIGWGHGADRNTVYFQFSTDVPPDAYRAFVRQRGVGIVAATPVRHVHYATSGFADSISGLNPGTNYVLVLRIRWVHGGPWTTAWTQPFATAP